MATPTQQDIDTARTGLEFSGDSMNPRTVDPALVLTVAQMIADERARVTDIVDFDAPADFCPACLEINGYHTRDCLVGGE